jgi:hypothetical protein
MNRHRALLFLLCSAICFVSTSFAQLPQDSPVFKALQKADSQLFDEAFNGCRLDVLQRLLHPDMQFMHDQNGLQNREEFFKGFQESICQNPKGKPIRKLVEGSLVVYPLMNEGKLYGAVQMGQHNFYMAEPGKPLRFTKMENSLIPGFL